jgi:hypothetical protein
MSEIFPQIISDSAGVPLSGYAATLARNLIARLEQFYPAFTGSWRVAVNERGRVIEVTNLQLSGRWGFLMHIDKIDSEGRKVVRAGGELLERYRITRAKNYGQVAEDMEQLKRDFRWEPIADHG